jgi:TRAP-type C4-dicarboxylate transport system permease large subunit
MVAAFIVAMRFAKVPAALAMIVAAVAGSIAAGYGVPIRRLAEGSTAYLHFLLIVIAAGVFMDLLRESGGLNILVRDITRAFYRIPFLLLLLLTLVVIFPGAITGSGTVAVLATGGIVGPVLAGMGIPHVDIAAFVALAGILSLIAPPVNVYAMVMAAGINVPYSGFFKPLAILTMVPAILIVLVIGRHRTRGFLNPDEVLKDIPPVPKGASRLAVYVPIATVISLMVATRVFPLHVPNFGLPLIFVIGIAVCYLCGVRVNLIRSFSSSMDTLLPIIGIMTAVGVLVQIMSLTGVKGLFVTVILTLPALLLYPGLFAMLPLGGTFLAFGGAAVFGLPYLWASLGRDQIIAITGLSLCISLGAMIPPTALVGKFAVSSVEYDGGYSRFLKRCAIPLLLLDLAGILVVYFANSLKFLV